MKQVLQGVAILSHPIFLPLWSVLCYTSIIVGYDLSFQLLGAIWIGFVYISLPILYFKKIHKMEFGSPSISERRTIYKVYTVVNIVFIMVSAYLFKEMVDFYIGAAFLHFILWLLTLLDLKASWHTAVWGYLVGATLMLQYRFGDSSNTLFISLFLLVLVFATRYFQKAHTPLQLFVGSAVGIISSLFLLL